MRTAALAAVLVVAASCGGARNAAPSSTSPALPSPAATAPSSVAPATATPAAAPGRPVEDVIARIDEARLVAHMNALVAVGSRDPRNPGHEKAAQYLRDALVKMSVSFGQHQVTEQGTKLSSLIVTVQPSAPGAQTSLSGAVLVCAHYDSTASGTPGWRPAADPAPGADEATGTAALLEITRILAGESASLRRPVVLAFFDGEDLGLKGSAAYQQTLAGLGQPIRFGNVIDIDAVGFNPTADRLDLIWYTNGSAGLRDRVAAANDRYKVGVTPLNPQLATDASTILDAAPFGLAGIPAVALVERYGDPDATYPGNPAFHTTQDTPDRVTNHRLWLKAAKLALATALEIARSG
jgi:Zn-dependent M28 family amino/carboxypeptidase